MQTADGQNCPGVGGNLQRDTPVDVWLNRVAWRLEPFPPHPYGTIWLLKDVSSDKIYDDIGSDWAKQQGAAKDNRLLNEVGIRGGMNFEVIKKRE